MNRFEGYYGKCSNEQTALAVVFGRAKSKADKKAFIQVITPDSSYNAEYNYDDYVLIKHPFILSIGPNTVSQKGMSVKIDNIEGSVTFGEFTPIRYDIMGPFKFFPFMECRHSIVSMNHTVTGQFSVSGQTVKFESGVGYIEGDRGKSFPKKYFWTQNNNPAISASCARIPYLGLRFTGAICIVHHEGLEYRLATYLGARVKEFNKNKLVIKQGRKRLEIEVLTPDENMQKLSAPIRGRMNRIITESISTTVHYRFKVKNKLLIDTISTQAAFEYSET